MRDTLRHLASIGKTVFISSHLLGEVSQLADVIGIIAAGKLVREGPIETLLSGEGRVRVRVAANEIERAVAALAPLGVAARVDGSDDGRPAGPGQRAGWLEVPIEPSRAAEVNRTLATAGIYASGPRERQRPRIALPRADLGRAGPSDGATAAPGRSGNWQ